MVCWSAYFLHLIGDHKGAADVILGRTKDDPTDKMRLGSDFHDFFEQETLKSGRVPKIFEFNLKRKLKPETYFEGFVPGLDWLFVRGRVDGVAEPEMTEYKVSDKSLSSFMSSIQEDLYAYFLELLGIVSKPIKTAFVCVYNPYPYAQEARVGIKHLTPDSKAEALDKLIDFAVQWRADREAAELRWWR